ncbi:MAG: hypothetical protein IJU99_06595 [Lachnospiraceae bacterium]|nr:hypothetical protein [Lachnospiraceae bacterium]MBR0154253.1 hypothetical protein [Lachnospiraceae bacterium]
MWKRMKKLSGTEIYVLIYQVASLLPLTYIFTATGSLAVFTKEGVLSRMFDLGVCCQPRVLMLLLSWVYRATRSEMAVYFYFPVAALVWGLLAKYLLYEGGSREGRLAKPAKTVILVLIAADLLLRLLPLRVNRIYGTGYQIAGFAVRLLCLVLIARDLGAFRRKEAQMSEK